MQWTRVRCTAQAAHAIQCLPGNSLVPSRLLQSPPRRVGQAARQVHGANDREHLPRGLRCPQLRSLSGAMRAPITARCYGRILRMRWRGFLPFALALLMGTGHAQRDSMGRYEPASRDTNRLWRPVGSHPVAAAAKVYSLFREPDAPVSGLSPSEWNQPGQRSPRRPAEAEAEARRPSRAQQLRRVQPPVQTRRNSPRGQPHPAARAVPSVARPVTPQRPAAVRQGRLTG